VIDVDDFKLTSSPSQSQARKDFSALVAGKRRDRIKELSIAKYETSLRTERSERSVKVYTSVYSLENDRMYMR